MPTRTLYFDESGFTGYNLLDASQPMFAIASTDIDEQRAVEILKDSFPNYQGVEFKFTNIWGSKNRLGLLKFAAHLSEQHEHLFTWMIDKRFGVLTKIVDLLIEPYITDAGYDFYADGFCRKYCNYIHFGLTQFAPPELYDSLLRRYQEFSRNPSLETLHLLQLRLKAMASSSDEHVRIFFEQMELGARLFHNYHDLEKFKGSNELQMTSMLAAVSHWRQRFPEDFAIVHDASSNFFRSKDIWVRVTNNNVPVQLHPMGDGTFVRYPLRVISTTGVDSKDHRSIQFCDILAGLTTRHFDPRVEGGDRQFLGDVIAAGLKDIDYNGIRPNVIFPDQIPPKRLTGPDIVDQMTEIMFGPHNNKT